jgi:D-arabinose 1-dehydrogenase-like Zn-dependent alcohol dehydrogenase
MVMRSFQVPAFGEPLVEATGETPEPQGTEVLLKVAACGVCHSDLHLWDGYFDLGGGKKVDMSRGISLPHTLGHEIAGEVVALGPEAVGVAVGERHVAFPWIGCGDCGLCQAGDEHLCNRPRGLGTNVDGGYADHVMVPHPRYLFAVGDLPMGAAGTLACSGLTAYSALGKVKPLGPDAPLLIVGAGGVGLAAVRLAKLVTGADPIVADIDPAKRQAALEAGAQEAIDPGEDGAARSLIKATGGMAAAIDFVGAPAAAQFGLDSLRKGGQLVIVGLYGGALTMPLPLFPFRNIVVRGSYVGSLAELGELVAMARDGRFELIPVEARDLGRAQETLDDLRGGRIVGRVVLTP